MSESAEEELPLAVWGLQWELEVFPHNLKL
jgi:hypothetical protein